MMVLCPWARIDGMTSWRMRIRPNRSRRAPGWPRERLQPLRQQGGSGRRDLLRTARRPRRHGRGPARARGPGSGAAGVHDRVRRAAGQRPVLLRGGHLDLTRPSRGPGRQRPPGPGRAGADRTRAPGRPFTATARRRSATRTRVWVAIREPTATPSPADGGFPRSPRAYRRPERRDVGTRCTFRSSDRRRHHLARGSPTCPCRRPFRSRG